MFILLEEANFIRQVFKIYVLNVQVLAAYFSAKIFDVKNVVGMVSKKNETEQR